MISLRSGLLAVLLAALCLGACGAERKPIDRVQPNALKKSEFAGEWYYQRTVIDVPSANGFTFVGNGAEMARIKFDIQERTLYVRRQSEFILGADDKAQKGQKYSGEVIAAFAISSHFDIKYAYNSTTGEQINVREENASDRPWYARDYMRVDWSNNLVHNYDVDFERESIESVPYYPQNTNADGTINPDAPLFSRSNVNGAEQLDYFDITSRIFAKAGTTYYEGYGEIPLCWLMGNETSECGAGEYGIRHSFKRFNPAHQYIPTPYKGAETDMFGFFWADRYTYDYKDGIKYQNKERYLSRHNIWVNWKDANGKAIPEKDRTVRPIVYYVNTDFPQDLKPTAQKVAGQWNKVFKDVVAATGNPYKGDMFILCPNNPVQAGDNALCGPAGLSPRLGDIRYSFMAYVPKYMTFGLLGLGPSNKDPDTGEILSGMAYVYHWNNTAAARTQEMVELLNGTRKATDFINAVDLTDWVTKVKAGQSMFEARGLEEAKTMVDRIANSDASKAWEGKRIPITPADEQKQREMGFDAWVSPYLDTMYKSGLLNGESISTEGRLASVNGTPIEKVLMNNEMKMAAGFAPDTEVTDAVLAKASITRETFNKFMLNRDTLRADYAAQHDCMYLPEMADDALMGLAKDLQDKKGEDVYNVLRDSIYTAVLAHETGHSLGLMHNFGGSDDAVNYFDQYWKLRDDGKVGPRLADPITDAEISGKIYNYGYSSIMDYAGRYTIDGGGVGKYDRAAMLWGYVGKVEVWADPGPSPTVWKQWYDGRSEIMNFYTSGPTMTHYTQLYNDMGPKLYDADNRKIIDASTLSADSSTAKDADGNTFYRVPYVYCSHGRSDLSDVCLTRDYGADSQERMKNYLDEWDTWYITRAFPRGNVGVSNYSYASRNYSRLYQKIKQWHDMYGLYNALLPQFYSPAQMTKFLTDPTAWGGQTWAVQNAFNYLIQTILMPDIPQGGGYALTKRPDGSSIYTAGGGLGISVNVTNARYYSTNWTFGGAQDCGYFWTECLSHIGFYIDKVMAIEALSDSRTNFVARASPIDIRQWQVGYYNTFSENIRQIHAALQSGDWQRVGPYVDKGKITWPNYAGDLSASHTGAIDPAADFTIQLYFGLLGQARFVTNFDHAFLDEAQVWLLGTAKSPQLDPSKIVTFTDPTNALVYAALNVPAGAGKAMIDHANLLKARSTYCDSGSATADTADDCAAKPINDPTAGPAMMSYVQLLKSIADVTITMSYGSALDP